MKNSPIKKNIIVISILFLIAFIMYGSSLNNYFIADDFEFIYKASNVTDIHSFFNYINGSVGTIKSFRPIINFSFLVDYFTWGTNPFGFHLTNIIFHILNAVLIFLILIYIFRSKWLGFSCALLFLVFPTNYESVGWIAGRTDIICTFFYLLSLLFLLLYVKNKNKYLFLFLTFSFYTLSIFSKEIGITFPIIGYLICYFYLKYNLETTNKLFNKKTTAQIALLFLVPLVYLFLRKLSMGEIIGGYYFMKSSPLNPSKDNLYDFLFLPYSFIKYILNYKFIVNEKLFSIKNPLELIRFIKIIVTVIISIIFFIKIKYSKKYKLIFISLLVFILWIYITALPEIHLLSVIGNEQTQENTRYLYLPSIGFTGILAIILNNYILKNKKICTFTKKINTIVFTSLVIVLIFASYCNSIPYKKASEISFLIISNIKNYNQNIIYIRWLPRDYYGAYISIPIAGFKLLENEKPNTIYSRTAGTDVYLNKNCDYSSHTMNNIAYLSWSNGTEKFKNNRDEINILISNWENLNNQLNNKLTLENIKWEYNNLSIMDDKNKLTKVTNNKPYILGKNLDMQTSQLNDLNLKLKMKNNNKTVEGKIYWLADNEKYFSEINTIPYILVKDDNDIISNTIKLCSYPNWMFNKKIKKIKIEFNLNNNEIFNILSIY